jgi:hypothetical protein
MATAIPADGEDSPLDLDRDSRSYGDLAEAADRVIHWATTAGQWP